MFVRVAIPRVRRSRRLPLRRTVPDVGAGSRGVQCNRVPAGIYDSSSARVRASEQLLGFAVIDRHRDVRESCGQGHLEHRHPPARDDADRLPQMGCGVVELTARFIELGNEIEAHRRHELVAGIAVPGNASRNCASYVAKSSFAAAQGRRASTVAFAWPRFIAALVERVDHATIDLE